MLTFEQMRSLFESARNKSKGKPIGNNLRVVQYGEGYGIMHHSTVIIAVKPNGVYYLDNGGWYSVTTKKHLNKYSPVGIFQKNRVWYVQTAQGVQEFHRGMAFTAQGENVTCLDVAA